MTQLGIDLEQEKITLEADEKLKETIVNKLVSMGYPEKGHNNFASKAKSARKKIKKI